MDLCFELGMSGNCPGNWGECPVKDKNKDCRKESFMEKYFCHCTVEKYDLGMEAETKAKTVIIVEAETIDQAESYAKSKLYKIYGTPYVQINNIIIEKIRRIKNG